MASLYRAKLQGVNRSFLVGVVVGWIRPLSFQQLFVPLCNVRPAAVADGNEGEPAATASLLGSHVSLESLTDGFFTLDRDWRFTYVNREAERVLRRPRAELLGQELWTMFTEVRGTVYKQE